MANSGEKSAAVARCWWSQGRRTGEQQKGGARFGFIGTQDSVRVKERESSRAARHRSAGSAGVLDGVAWQSLGIVCPTWNGEGRTAEAAWRWEEGWGDAWKGGVEL
jgi:hypothetical protein